MSELIGRAWIEIDLDRIGENLALVREHLPKGCDLTAVVKADAYSMGAVKIARYLAGKGVRRFAVATLPEGAILRQAGIEGEILCLGYTPPRFAEKLARFGVTQTLTELPYAKKLASAALAAGVTVPAQVAVDTGMHRIGFSFADPASAAEAYRLRGLFVTGAFTHFSSADDGSDGADEYCQLQFSRFASFQQAMEERGVSIGERHMCNSGGTQKYACAHFDTVRVGLLLFGANAACGIEPWELKQAVSVKAAVAMVKPIEKGACVSYSRTYAAPEPRRVATLCIGYADGYPRELSNRGKVILHGRWAPILGRICMDQMIVDVTGIPEAKAGDTATVLGQEGGLFLGINDLAELQPTAPHEVLTRFNRRLPRCYFENGALRETVDYTDFDVNL